MSWRKQLAKGQRLKDVDMRSFYDHVDTKLNKEWMNFVPKNRLSPRRSSIDLSGEPPSS